MYTLQIQKVNTWHHITVADDVGDIIAKQIIYSDIITKTDIDRFIHNDDRLMFNINGGTLYAKFDHNTLTFTNEIRYGSLTVNIKLTTSEVKKFKEEFRKLKQ